MLGVCGGVGFGVGNFEVYNSITYILVAASGLSGLYGFRVWDSGVLGRLLTIVGVDLEGAGGAGAVAKVRRETPISDGGHLLRYMGL